MSKKSTLHDKEVLEAVIKKSLSKAQVLNEFNLKSVGGNYSTLKKYIKLYNIDISHFTGKGWNVGSRYRPVNQKQPIESFLKKNRSCNSNHLKNRLIKEGFLKNECDDCGITEWLDKPITLELDHINGINDDNRIENLRILCPNCHSQTKTFRGRNIQKLSASSEKENVEPAKLRETLTGSADGNPEPSPKKRKGAETLRWESKSTKITFCKTCKKVFKSHKNKFCNIDCYRSYKSSNIPSPGELLQKFDDLKTYTAVGNFYKVSGNAVKKWCKKYDLVDRIKRKSRPQIDS